MENLWYYILLVLSTLVTLFLTGLGTERVTEAIKILLEYISALLKPQALAKFVTHPILKLLLALFVAWAGTKGLDINIFKEFPLFRGLDPQLVVVLNMFFVWVSANFLHTRIERGQSLVLASNLPARREIEKPVV